MRIKKALLFSTALCAFIDRCLIPFTQGKAPVPVKIGDNDSYGPDPRGTGLRNSVHGIRLSTALNGPVKNHHSFGIFHDDLEGPFSSQGYIRIIIRRPKVIVPAEHTGGGSAVAGKTGIYIPIEIRPVAYDKINPTPDTSFATRQ